MLQTCSLSHYHLLFLSSLLLNKHIQNSSYTGNNKINWIECVWTWLTPWESLKIIVKIYKLMSLFSASHPSFYLILENILIARGTASRTDDDMCRYILHICIFLRGAWKLEWLVQCKIYEFPKSICHRNLSSERGKLDI